MSSVMIAFFMGIGAGTWIYNKLMRSSGGNTQNSAIAAGLTGLLIWVIGAFVLKSFGF